MDANERIRSSFARVERRADHVAKYFYSHLFARNPGVRGLFPADMTEQRDRLFAALTHVVQHLDDPALPEYLMALGRDHRKFDARPAHYAAVGESLIAALRFGLPATWDDETEGAWLGAYKVLADAMISGAEAADKSADPPWWNCRVLARRPALGATVLTLLPDRDLTYAAGQFVSVSAPQRPQVWRPYSVACAPRPDRTIDLHVSRIDGGLLSPALADEVHEDDILRVGAPSGTMVLPSARPLRPVSFIAAGTGWAPVRALAEDMLQRWPPTQTRVVIAARSAGHVYDADAIDALARDHPWMGVKVVTPLRGERPDAAAGRLRAALTAYDWTGQDVFIAGPGHFITAITRLVTDHGAPPEHVHHDHVPPPDRSARVPGHTEWFLNPPRPQWINPADR